MDEDKRGAIRWQVVLPIRYINQRKATEGWCHTQDLSTLGAKLAMEERHKPGDHMTMILDIPNSGTGKVCVDADVVWQKEGKDYLQECKYLTGVAFRRIMDCHKKSIIDYILNNFPSLYTQKWWEGTK